jgi:hypothetical protein
MKGVRWLGWVASLWLIFNMVAMPTAWGGANASGGLRGAIQLAIFLGFILILLFDLLSSGMILIRACWREGRVGGERCVSGWLLVLAFLALIGLAGAKVMADEIARETPLGGAGGEWVVLFICLTLQLAYLAAFLFFKPASPEEGKEGT